MWVFICGSACAAERPNILVILVILADDLGGSTFHRTPNLDRLARQSVFFIKT